MSKLDLEREEMEKCYRDKMEEIFFYKQKELEAMANDIKKKTNKKPFNFNNLTLSDGLIVWAMIDLIYFILYVL